MNRIIHVAHWVPMRFIWHRIQTFIPSSTLNNQFRGLNCHWMFPLNPCPFLLIFITFSTCIIHYFGWIPPSSICWDFNSHYFGSFATKRVTFELELFSVLDVITIIPICYCSLNVIVKNWLRLIKIKRDSSFTKLIRNINIFC